MAELSPSDFAEFFEAVHKHEPFPWQRLLLEKVAAGADWPQVIDLPTASGKTACIDIAVFTLALQAELDPLQRTASRRIFFVVDRRIVVDEAFQRAEKLADKLAEAESGILKTVADRLRHVSGGETPLAVAKLRGGTARARQRWSENPLQPAVITSTVDQIGSRLLFRSYGGSPLIAPIHAAMAAYDSLIILDEAHCAQPFMQTALSVRNYLDSDKWSHGKVAIAPPLKLVVMSATAPLTDAAGNPLDRFPSPQERAAALDDPEIIKRSTNVKSARLEAIDNGGHSKRASALAREAISNGCKRVAVMVNRVKLASEIATAIKDTKGLPLCDVVLLTGRMRPIDRDDLVNQWSRFLRASNAEEPQRPILVVTTQCLEVGADFSFDHLITQCASIDALIQRFGRLDRLGLLGKTNSVILAAKQDISDAVDDPIYGKAVAETWKWLMTQSKDSAEPGTVNFAISAVGETVRSLRRDTLDPMLAPHPDAPILMPSHVDILCQTAPHPVPDIDIPAYLHGVGRGQPEVRVAFRVDVAGADGKLQADDEAAAAYCELFTLCPVGKQECLSVPTFRLQGYLLGRGASSAGDEDVEGAAVDEESKSGSDTAKGMPFLRCRGGGWKLVNATDSHDLIRPNDLVVLPMLPNGKIPDELGTHLNEAAVDRAEEAAWIAWPRENAGETSGIFLRVNKTVLEQPPLIDAAHSLLDWLNQNALDEGADSPDIESLRAALAAVPDGGTAGEESTLARFAKVCKAAELAIIKPKYIKPHPVVTGAWIVAIPGAAIEMDNSTSDEDAATNSSRSISLASHLKDVESAARKFACGLPPGLQEPLGKAGQWHDLGKLDPRFQEILSNIGSQPLAKSEARFSRKPDFRHEMISLQIVQNCLAEQLPAEEMPRELLLHLIAAHHGHARPFAPVRDDSDPEDILAPNGFDPAVKLTAEARNRPPKPHHLGSGIPDRFWFLTRHFGWWGLAYLESMLRLADWEASANPSTAATAAEETPEEVHS
ncbi:MAG: type I-G CRISPR-associated helicase/endonuclease Cas3g [Phycisphaerae bacterium]